MMLALNKSMISVFGIYMIIPILQLVMNLETESPNFEYSLFQRELHYLIRLMLCWLTGIAIGFDNTNPIIWQVGKLGRDLSLK